MRWERIGLIFSPAARYTWMTSHAALPVPVHLGETRYRVYFACRDPEQRSSVGFFEVDLLRPHETLAVSQTPVLAPGPLGHFDDAGTLPSCIVQCGQQFFLYYTGWNQGRGGLFYYSVGLAVSEDGGRTFARVSPAPILSRSRHDPCLVASPFVLVEGERWRMWYVSGVRWTLRQSDPVAHYHIKYAESSDGIDWERRGVVCIDFASEDEEKIGRMCVLRDAGGYRAWYPYNRGQGYRIGYAESADGILWVRRDGQADFNRSTHSREPEVQTYPYVIVHGAYEYMFYNGNAFGRDGVALAKRSGGPFVTGGDP